MMRAEDAYPRFIRREMPGLRRRWFQGDAIDLAIWQDGQGRVHHFQLVVCSDRVIDFESGSGLVTGKIDAAGGVGNLAASPSVLPDSEIDLETLRLGFQEFTREPPLQARPILKFVAESLDEALALQGRVEADEGTAGRSWRVTAIQKMLGNLYKPKR